MNPISQLLISFAQEMTNQTQTQIAAKFGLSRAGLKKALDPNKPVESWLIGTLLKLSQAFSITIVIYAGQVSTFRWTIPLDAPPKINMASILTEFIQQEASPKAAIARQLALSRRTLYHCLAADKPVESFKLGTLLKFTKFFPMTIIISNGKINAHREKNMNKIQI